MDKWGIGIIITYVWKEIPFIILVIYAVLTNIDEKCGIFQEHWG